MAHILIQTVFFLLLIHWKWQFMCASSSAQVANLKMPLYLNRVTSDTSVSVCYQTAVYPLESASIKGK